jgi:hypothetical protein
MEVGKEERSMTKKRRGVPARKKGAGPLSYPGEPVLGPEEDAPESPAAAELAPELEDDLEEQAEHNFGDRQDDEAHLMPEGEELPGELHLGNEAPVRRRKTKGERS